MEETLNAVEKLSLILSFLVPNIEFLKLIVMYHFRILTRIVLMLSLFLGFSMNSNSQIIFKGSIVPMPLIPFDIMFLSSTIGVELNNNKRVGIEYIFNDFRQVDFHYGEFKYNMHQIALKYYFIKQSDSVEVIKGYFSPLIHIKNTRCVTHIHTKTSGSDGIPVDQSNYGFGYGLLLGLTKDSNKSIGWEYAIYSYYYLNNEKNLYNSIWVYDGFHYGIRVYLYLKWNCINNRI